MLLSSNIDQTTQDKQRKQDFIHHSDRRRRFQEEGRRALIETCGKREHFGKRAESEPKRRLFSFRKAKRRPSASV